MARPRGTVTFLFTDIEGSTKLVQDLGDRYEPALDRHRELLRKAFAAHQGSEVGTEGDSFFVAFERATDGLRAALDGQLALGAEPWEGPPIKVRMGLHTGEASLRGDDYTGLAVHEAARVSSAAHGGQVLVSGTTRDLVEGSLPQGVTLVDLGEHRLKDLSHPTRLYNLAHADLQAELPPPRTLSVLPNNLPQQLSSFVGRETQLETITVRVESARLLTLLGAGGSGKTRLALQAAADLITDHPDGVWLVDLAPITDPDGVMRRVAEAVGAREEEGRPLGDVVEEFLRGKRVLLVIDNCEHLTAPTAAVVDRLLRTSPDLRILATSREALGAEGEAVFQVPSLSVPDPGATEDLGASEAVRLFRDRAEQAAGGFVLDDTNTDSVVEVCRRLDGLPLAIELAAARVRMLSPREIADRLDDRFKLLTGGVRTGLRRQQTLRATVDWSYELLSEEERRLLRRLSAFVGGFTLEAAEQVCSGDGIDQADVLDLVGALVDRSLVVAGPATPDGTRYRLLETIREYGREALAASGEAATTWSRHLDWCADLAGRAIVGLRGGEQAAWLERIDAELENARQAMSWATEDGDPVLGLQIAACLSPYWYTRWFVHEGIRWIDRLKDRCGDRPIPLTTQAIALVGRGFLTWQFAKPAEARPYYEECLGLPQDEETLPWIAEAKNDLGLLCWIVDSDVDRGSKLLSDAAEMRERIGDLRGLRESVANQGALASWAGRYEEARPFIARAAKLAREVGAPAEIAFSLRAESVVARDVGEPDRSLELLNEALELYRSIGDRSNTQDVLLDLAREWASRGDLDRSDALIAEAESIGRAAEDVFNLKRIAAERALLTARRGDVEAARLVMHEVDEAFVAAGSELWLAMSKMARAQIEQMAGLLDDARRDLLWATERFTQGGMESQLEVAHVLLALVELAAGDLPRAGVHAEEALARAERRGLPSSGVARTVMARVRLEEGSLDAAQELVATSIESLDRARYAFRLADAVEVAGWVAAERGDAARAVRLLAATDAARAAMGAQLGEPERERRERAIEAVRSRMDPDEFRVAWEDGTRSSLDDAVALALA